MEDGRVEPDDIFFLESDIQDIQCFCKHFYVSLNNFIHSANSHRINELDARKNVFLYLVCDKNITRISGIFQNLKRNVINIASTWRQ